MLYAFVIFPTLIKVDLKITLGIFNIDLPHQVLSKYLSGLDSVRCGWTDAIKLVGAFRTATEKLKTDLVMCHKFKHTHFKDVHFQIRTEVKNAWSYTFTLTFTFMARCLVKYRVHLQG